MEIFAWDYEGANRGEDLALHDALKLTFESPWNWMVCQTILSEILGQIAYLQGWAVSFREGNQYEMIFGMFVPCPAHGTDPSRGHQSNWKMNVFRSSERWFPKVWFFVCSPPKTGGWRWSHIGPTGVLFFLRWGGGSKNHFQIHHLEPGGWIFFPKKRVSEPWLRVGKHQKTLTRWWFETFVIFTPTWGNGPNWLIFFKWVETTN